MSSKKPLSDTEAYDRLHQALLVLGDDMAATVHADTALETARRALKALQIGLTFATEKAEGRLPPTRSEPEDR